MTPERLRDFAYRCFLGGAGCTALVYLGDLLGRSGVLPQSLAAGLLVFVLLPLTLCGAVAGLAGMGLTLWIRRDPRLYALSVLTMGVIMFWLRMEQHGADPAWALAYPVGVALFSTHWWLERRGGGK